MRVRKTKSGLTLQAVAGSHVVLLGMSMERDQCDGHLGFAIHRTDPAQDEAYWMEGLKTFAETDPGFVPGSKYPTNQHPIQGFTWSDFSAKPGRSYVYRVQALRGTPKALEVFKEVEVEVRTEAEEDGDHDVFFNRGAAASQEYARRFGNVPPREADDDVPDRTAPDFTDPRWGWLSRDAMEAIEKFVARAKNGSFGLRVAAYEFRLRPFADALRKAHKDGADVKILFDACANAPDEHGTVFPRDLNRAVAKAAKVKPLCAERITRDDVKRPPISHHKFIVLLESGKPRAVLTGSTNFSLGGVYGQSNVVHVVDDPEVAAAYLAAWNAIAAEPEHQDLRTTLSAMNHIPNGKPPVGTTAIFSPQETRKALDWYAKLAGSAQGALFMTFAFGINKVFLDVYRNGNAKLRYAMLEKLLGPGVKKEKRPAAEKEMRKLRAMKENRFAVGSTITTNRFDRWVRERRTGLNQHVQYVHTKFMLVDPLSNDPIVVTGSANFSDASTTANDENMLVIRGNRRVADIYLGEYMRLWNHYAFREWAENHQDTSGDATFKHLDVENRWWREYFGGTDRSRQREYFAGIS